MAQYIDGYVFPIAKKQFDDYQKLACSVAEVWKKYGATEYKEFVGDDLNIDGTKSFHDIIESSETEVLVFGWVTFDSRDSRDLAHKKVAADPIMAELMSKFDTGFDAQRMACGGFRQFVPVSSE